MGQAGRCLEYDLKMCDFGFDSKSIRATFVRKVFTLIAVMLTVVTAMCAMPFLFTDVHAYVKTHPALYYVSYAVFFVVCLMLVYCENVRRSFPSNLIATGIFTVSIGLMTMMICARYKLSSVFLCLLITTICCGGIVLFSMQTKYDLTSGIGIICILSLALLVFGIVATTAAIAFRIPWLLTVYSGLAALIFMFYLAFDIQMVMGGRENELSPEQHIFAAIQVFLDIINIFWRLLSLFGSRYSLMQVYEAKHILGKSFLLFDAFINYGAFFNFFLVSSRIKLPYLMEKAVPVPRSKVDVQQRLRGTP